jgi:hypothetical protein
VLPELEDLEKCLRVDYAFDTDVFPIPSENSHLELMMRIGKLIKEHEAEDTLFVVYYGGHARIDESRQSTWCATRHPDSPWLQWSAIQTLLERSTSDVLILLDCCAGAASATFPSGTSITETISASSWDAIAPDPGRYSFTNALIEVLQEWRIRTFSAAMLHAEVLARLKHPRPITINGKHFEARSTPVHFMMTSNHKAPSIEISRVVPTDKRPPSPPQDLTADATAVEAAEDAVAIIDSPVEEPDENTPHVMISLALEDDQKLDMKAWEKWLADFPALAKYVKIQGAFKSHSTLLLLSMPVMIWDLLPENHATSFIAFIRSSNLLAEKAVPQSAKTNVAVTRPAEIDVGTDTESAFSMRPGSFFSDTTYTPTETSTLGMHRHGAGLSPYILPPNIDITGHAGIRPVRSHYISQPTSPGLQTASPSSSPVSVYSRPLRSANSTTSLATLQRHSTSASHNSERLTQTMIMNQQRSGRRTTFATEAPEPPRFSAHVETRLEEYYEREPRPNDAQKEFVASNLGIEPWHVEVGIHHITCTCSSSFLTYLAGMVPPPT